MIRNSLYLILLFGLLQSCSRTNYLKNCESTLSKIENKKLVKFHFEEQLNELGHLSEPWETNTFLGKGFFLVNNSTFLKQDTLVNSRGRSYTSITDYNNDTLLYLDYGDKELLPITEALYFEKVINTARYTPITVFQHFLKNEKEAEVKIRKNHAIHSLKIGEYLTKLFINTTNNLIDKITYLSYDELYGDVSTSFLYSSYVSNEGLTYPTAIVIEKISGKVRDTVKVLKMEMTSSNFNLLEKPDGYQLAEPKVEGTSKIEVSKYNDYIHLIDLEHTDDRVMLVEFEEYMLVAEAPLNAKNGELIISEAKKIAPSKPIKYFVFGHHHPHYLGGLRAFIHKRATILCTDVSKNYVEYIANAPHALQPDSLQLEPKLIKTQIIRDSLLLGYNNKMKIYFIGSKSEHTKDYLIYYFPNDKLLFQDDLCWIPKNGAIKKAGNRQAGLYNAIKELDIQVDTIIQSWPVSGHKVKTFIPFADLEKSIYLGK